MGYLKDMQEGSHPVWFLAVLLVVGLMMAACSGPSFPDPIPVASVDPASINLVPYIGTDLAISGVVPEGWVEAMPKEFPGMYLAGRPLDRPGTVLIQRLEAGLTADQAAAAWLPRLNLEAVPEQEGSRMTASLNWSLHSYQVDDPSLGPRKGAIAWSETDEGVYLVILVTAPEEFDLLREQVLLPAVDALSPVTDPPTHYEEYAEWPVVATIEGVGDLAHETVEFTLSACTPLRVYGIGEGSQGGMRDYGSIEQAETGQVVWQMAYPETDSAGCARNRRVDRALWLPAGTYRLHYQTDASHSSADWGDRPPGHRFWGITLFQDQTAAADRPACWERPNAPEELGWSSAKLQAIIPELERLEAAAVMVVADGQVVFEWGAVANNLKAHSMRKSLMSALYGIYAADGTIDLSQTLRELNIDDLMPLTAEEETATVTHLLMARSGVYIPAAGEAPSMKDDRPERGSHRPGAHWYYNNWDFNALGTILDRATGGTVYQAFQSRIADPIGMQDYDPERLAYNYEYWLSGHPYYGFRISARDLARFGQLFLQEGVWDGAELIPASWVEESTTAYSSTSSSGTYSGYGYMWWIAAEDYGEIKEGSYAASGMGGHTLEVLPDQNTVIVVRFNTDDPSYAADVSISTLDGLILKILEAREA